jgi:hypothetical protein
MRSLSCAVQLPVHGAFDANYIVLFLVSWYSALASYAAAAHFRPHTAFAVLLCAMLAVGLLLSGAIAPTLRTLYTTARPLYHLTGAQLPSQVPGLVSL